MVKLPGQRALQVIAAGKPVVHQYAEAPSAEGAHEAGGSTPNDHLFRSGAEHSRSEYRKDKGLPSIGLPDVWTGGGAHAIFGVVPVIPRVHPAIPKSRLQAFALEGLG